MIGFKMNEIVPLILFVPVLFAWACIVIAFTIVAVKDILK